MFHQFYEVHNERQIEEQLMDEDLNAEHDLFDKIWNGLRGHSLYMDPYIYRREVPT